MVFAAGEKLSTAMPATHATMIFTRCHAGISDLDALRPSAAH